MADRSGKNIEDVQPNDRVLATDPATGNTAIRKVTDHIVTDDDKHFNELTIATPDGPKKLTATDEHPFWSPSAHRWLRAKELKPGSSLLTSTHTEVKVQANRAFDQRTRTYNITVEGLHTYYVLAGSTPVLVHNARKCKIVFEGQGGRFGDLSPGPVGDDLTAHHMPQAALNHTSREDGGAVVMKLADHKLTRTYGPNGAKTKLAEAHLPFRTVLARDIWDMRRVGQLQYGDPGFYNKGILDMLSHYRRMGQM
ncbi:hypothetical protein DF18_33555 [Streptomyces rimosus]|nr:hypothetical protein DF18_33555 [Streptomyces rimosus]